MRRVEPPEEGQMKVIFLDRDGVINEYPGDKKYVTSWEQFKFISGSIQAIKSFKQQGFKLFVISNQAGVNKGLYSQKELDRITKNMLIKIKKHHADIDGVFYCTHKPDDNCACRKPKTELLRKALSTLTVRPQEIFFIGDSFKDMEAAKEFGAVSVLVLSGREKISNRNRWKFEPDYIFDNLLLAAHYLCAHQE